MYNRTIRRDNAVIYRVHVFDLLLSGDKARRVESDNLTGEKVDVNGSQATDCLIYITARGRITDLTVTRIKID